MDKREVIDAIVSEYRAGLGPCKYNIQIQGDSPFIRALERRFKEWGVKYHLVYKPEPDEPIIADYEGVSTCTGFDIDTKGYPFTACSEGILRLCERIGVSGKTVVLIGRGNAVKGLERALIAMNATVCVCHSKTSRSAFNALVWLADIVINTASIEAVNTRERSIVIDVSGQLTGADYSSSDMGKLTTAILAYRASNLNPRWEYE